MSNSAAPSPQEQEAILFALAIEKPEAERGAFLRATCGANHALRQRLKALLGAHENTSGWMGGLNSEADTEVSVDCGAGQSIDHYKLLERLGEGGCGVVFVAEQTAPVRRRVALKVVKLGMDTRQVVARFEAERQALAMMDHPNIAKVLDAGMTAQGRPYFVMELVRGVRITEYCDENQLTTRERLELFIKVCQAIQHAHQKGIIHRDIKPSNILVTIHDGAGVPKVIDFGIAKAIEGRLTDATIYTHLNHFVGTPAYMSPEQAEMSGLDIDTRSDIYSLGALLYELLTSSTPFDTKALLESGLDTMRKTIREKEPPRPSTRLSQRLASKSQIKNLESQIHSDLDWIVMKCLEKDRTRRYETANGLAGDIRRHLENEPVSARPPSAAYKFQKAFRRNRLAFAAGGIVVIGLLISVAALSFALVRERALKSESARANSIATFVIGMLNDAVPELINEGNGTGTRVVLESADRLVSATLSNSPAAELAVRNTMQTFYGLRLADHINARKQTERIAALLPLVPDDRLPLNLLREDLEMDVAAARFWAGSAQGYTEMERLAEEFKRRGPAWNRIRARTFANLGSAKLDVNDPVAAEPLLAEAYQLHPGRTGPGFFYEDFAGSPYARVLIQNGKYQLAEEVARETVRRINIEIKSDPSWKVAANLHASLGSVDCYPWLVEAKCRLGQSDEAETLLKEQLGSRPARAWTPAQQKSLKTLELAVQAYGGQWREAARGFIAVATNATADVSDWHRGITAAISVGDTNAFTALRRVGRMRFVGNADTESASLLFLGLVLLPLDDDVSVTLPDLFRVVEEGADHHWAGATLLFLSAQLAYRKGEYAEALHSLNTWERLKDERPVHALSLHYVRVSALPDFWRALILGRLGRKDEGLKACHNGEEKLRAVFTTERDFFAGVIKFYTAQALRHEARMLLHGKKIETIAK